MDTLSYRTKSARKEDVERKWYVVDAEDVVLGHLGTKVATILRGKHKPRDRKSVGRERVSVLV